MPKFFGGKSPFDDPFFTEPLGGWFGGTSWPEDGGARKQIAIEELNPEGAEPSKDVLVKNSDERNRKPERMSFRRVAYGGINGVYYSCSEGKRVGDGEVVLVEMNEEDMTIGESLHTISKGVRNKGHSVTTKHSANGQVDMLQTLHNLNEDFEELSHPTTSSKIQTLSSKHIPSKNLSIQSDLCELAEYLVIPRVAVLPIDEVASFEETWKANADEQFPGWNEGFKSLEKAGEDCGGWREWDQWLLPPPSAAEYLGNNAGSLLEHDSEWQDDDFSSQTRRVVRVD